jgi:twitching motility protein PilI
MSRRSTPFDTLVEYERLSLAHVAGRPEQVEAPGHWRGVGFRLGTRRFVAAFEEVVEIMPLPPVAPVPGALPWMLGVANVRGSLFPVLDLKQFLEGERTVITEHQRVLVVRQQGGNAAVLIDELYGQRTFNDEHIADPGELLDGRYRYFVTRAFRLGGALFGVFDMDRLVRTPEFRQAAA